MLQPLSCWRNKIVAHSKGGGRAVLNKNIKQNEDRFPYSSVALKL